MDPDSIRVDGSGPATITDLQTATVPRVEEFDDVHPPSSPRGTKRKLSDEPDSDPDDNAALRSVKDDLRAAESALTKARNDAAAAASELHFLNAYGNSLDPKEVGVSALTEFLDMYRRRREEGNEMHVRVSAEVSRREEEVQRLCRKMTGVERAAAREKEMKEQDRARDREKSAFELAQKEKGRKRERDEQYMFWTGYCGKLTVRLDGGSDSVTPASSRRGSLTVASTDAAAAAEATLCLSYVLPAASWTPRYDLAITTSPSVSTRLVYRAQFRNSSAETWRDVRAVFSSSQAQFSRLDERVPGLRPWRVRLGTDTVNTTASTGSMDWCSVLQSRDETRKMPWEAGYGTQRTIGRGRATRDSHLCSLPNQQGLLQKHGESNLFGAPPQPQGPPLFGGVSEPQPKKPTGGGLFGGQSQPQPPMPSVPLFGHPRPQIQSSSLFGGTHSQPQSEKPSGGGLFGEQPQPQPEKPSGSLFGGQPPTQPQKKPRLLFGAAPEAQFPSASFGDARPQGSSSLFGGGQAPAESASSQPGLFTQARQGLQSTALPPRQGGPAQESPHVPSPLSSSAPSSSRFPSPDPDTNTPLHHQSATHAQTGLTTTYTPSSGGKIPQIPPSASPHHQLLSTLTLPSTLSYTIVPKHRAAAFFAARIKNTSDITLLRGAAGVTVDGSFLGSVPGESLFWSGSSDSKTMSKPACAPGEPLDLSLGIDPSIGVTYSTPFVKKGSALGSGSESAGMGGVAGFFSRKTAGEDKDETAVFRRVCTVRNSKSSPVDLVVIEQVPVSEAEDKDTGKDTDGDKDKEREQKLDITIREPAGLAKEGDVADFRPKGGAGSGTVSLSKNGELRWEVCLPPREEGRFVLEYEARVPVGAEVLEV